MNEKHKIFLERLGITPGPYAKERIDIGEPEHRITAINPVGVKGVIAECYSKENALLFSASPEMLVWLVRDLYIQDLMETEQHKNIDSVLRNKYGDEIADHMMTMYVEQKSIIESATSRHWEEVRKIYEDVMEGSSENL